MGFALPRGSQELGCREELRATGILQGDFPSPPDCRVQTGHGPRAGPQPLSLGLWFRGQGRGDLPALVSLLPLPQGLTPGQPPRPAPWQPSLGQLASSEAREEAPGVQGPAGQSLRARGAASPGRKAEEAELALPRVPSARCVSPRRVCESAFACHLAVLAGWARAVIWCGPHGGFLASMAVDEWLLSWPWGPWWGGAEKVGLRGAPGGPCRPLGPALL